jgi:hypothetical protein
VPYGMPRPSRMRGVLTWGRVPVELAQVRSKADLARFLHRLGWRVGRLRGALAVIRSPRLGLLRATLGAYGDRG